MTERRSRNPNTREKHKVLGRFIHRTLTDKPVDVDTLPVIDSHGWTNHLVYELVGEAGSLHGFVDGLIEQAGEGSPSKRVKQALVTAEGIVVRLVAIDPSTGDKKYAFGHC